MFLILAAVFVVTAVFAVALCMVAGNADRLAEAAVADVRARGVDRDMPWLPLDRSVSTLGVKPTSAPPSGSSASPRACDDAPLASPIAVPPDPGVEALRGTLPSVPESRAGNDPEGLPA